MQPASCANKFAPTVLNLLALDAVLNGSVIVILNLSEGSYAHLVYEDVIAISFTKVQDDNRKVRMTAAELLRITADIFRITADSE